MAQCNIGGEGARLKALHRYEILDTEPEEAFDSITRIVRSVLQMPMAVVSLVDHDRQWFKSRQGVRASETPRNISFCTHTIQDIHPLIVVDALADPRFRDSPIVRGEPHIRFYAGVPLRTRDGYNVGALCSMDTKVRELTGDQVKLLQDLARLVVDEFELRLASTDSLTGAMTRRSFVERARGDVERSRRHDRALSCAVLDVDHFKAINDTYGHGAGDMVLQKLVSVCRSGLRASDYLGRIGGEEFAIMLPETSILDALDVTERIRKMIVAARVELAGHEIHFTASIGVSECSAKERTIERLLETADVAMYDAKADGRNRVVGILGGNLKITDAEGDVECCGSPLIPVRRLACTEKGGPDC